MLILALGIAFVLYLMLHEESGVRLPATPMSPHAQEDAILEMDENAQRGPWGAVYVAETGMARQQVLNNLRDYLARYRQSHPSLTIAITGSTKDLELLGRRIGDALSKYDMGRFDPAATVPDTLPDGELPVLRCAASHALIARQLLATLEPYLGGEIHLRYEDGLRLDRMQLVLRGTPRFSADGEASFRPENQTE